VCQNHTNSFGDVKLDFPDTAITGQDLSDPLSVALGPLLGILAGKLMPEPAALACVDTALVPALAGHDVDGAVRTNRDARANVHLPLLK